MDSVGLSTAWAATRADARQQAVATAMLKQQADSQQALVKLLEQAAGTPPPAPPGQGQQVDKRV